MTTFAEQEKSWTQRFAENEGTLQRTLVELQKIDSFLQRVELQNKGCVQNYTELQSQFQFSQWKADCEGTQKFVREFSELAPRLEEAISKMGAFDSEILRLENAMKSWQETAMQEIQKRDDHLDFLTSQAEEFQRENAELREKMNIIENILVTRAAESAAAQAATAVSTAVTANSLEPAASAAQMGLQTLGEIPEGDGSRGAPVVVENMSENPARLGHGFAQGGVAGAPSPPALDVHMTASTHFARPTVMGPQPTPPPHPTTPQATSPCFGVLEGLRGALTGLGR